MKLLPKDRLSELLGALAVSFRVFVPATDGGVKQFFPWPLETGEPELSGCNVLKPPKDLLFPQSELLYTYRLDGLDAVIEEATVPRYGQLIFGLRSCDARSFQLLDQVFLTRGFEDNSYKTRRQNTVLVAFGCLDPGPTCFCSSFGIDPARAGGVDVQVFDLGDDYGLEASSKTGEGVLNLAGDVLTEGECPAPAAQTCSLAIDLEGLPEKLSRMFGHPVWDDLYLKCLGCGICTYLCPTCHCFDIQGEERGNGGFRFRCWDSCMFADFTLMAGGANPRPTQKERFRQRFLHKLQYFPERYGEFGCVGCGRCLVNCPVNVDIVRLARTLQEVRVDA